MIRNLVLASLLATLFLAVQAQDAPSQSPLISRNGANVKPNIMLTLDDSGSMLMMHMPEGDVRLGAYVVTSPIGANWYGIHPKDTSIQTAGNYDVIASVAGSTNWRQRFSRSADTNYIYYNPRVRYRPWLKADGVTRYPAAGWTAATIELGDTSTVNLSASGPVTTTWCFPPPGTPNVTQDGCLRNLSLNFTPGLYYVLKKDASGAWLNPQDASSYDEYNLNAGSVNGNAVITYPRGPARSDCTASSTSCSADEEKQNFANWLVYYRSRFLFLKAALSEALAGLDEQVRLGYGRINAPKSSLAETGNLPVIEAGVRDFTQDQKNRVYSWLIGIIDNGNTPLRQAVQAVGKYYMSPAADGPWSDTPGTVSNAPQKTCRRAYHILVTDGYWSDGSVGLNPLVGDVDGQPGDPISGPNGQSYRYTPSTPYASSATNTLADFAMYYWRQDLRPDLANGVQASLANPAFWQSMTNYTVGLGVRGTLDPASDLPALIAGTKSWGADKIDDLWHAGLNSRGQYFSAGNAGELADAILSAVRTALERELLEAGVATAAVTLEAGNRKYIPRYKTAAWTGDVEAWVLDGNGQTTERVWSASQKLPAWDQRNIVTWDRSTPAAVSFTWASLGDKARTSLPADAGESLVNYIRGDRSNENAGANFRVREQLLGDFVDSTPVYAKDRADEVLKQMADIGGATYAAYTTAKATRTGVLYVGGNDGMLHAFTDTRGAESEKDGREIFAYIPQAVHGNLATLAARSYGSAGNYHRFFVDGPLVETDAYVSAPRASEASWRNYLLGSTGAGARAVFAIDITDPGALGTSSVRWEISNADHGELGYVTFPIAVGVLPTKKWVALFGNGYGGGKATLFVVELETGAVHKLDVGAADASNGLGGVAIVRDSSGYITSLYAGDQKGSLWKFNYDADADSSFKIANGGTALFAADNGQPIVQPPVVLDHSLGGRMLVFGTGRLITTTDADSTVLQAVYGVRDQADESLTLPLTSANLVPRDLLAFQGTAGNKDQAFFTLVGADINWKVSRGWVVQLAASGYSGLRMLYPAQKLSNEAVLIGAVAPAQNVPSCELRSGLGLNLLIPGESGLPSTRAVFDTNGDGLVNSSDEIAAGYSTRADGQDSVLRARMDPGATTQRLSIQNTVGQMIANLPVAQLSGAVVSDRTWRRILRPPIP